MHLNRAYYKSAHENGARIPPAFRWPVPFTSRSGRGERAQAELMPFSLSRVARGPYSAGDFGKRDDYEDKGDATMKEETKKVLFIKAVAALTAYQTAVAVNPTSVETKIRHERFCAIWEIIEDAGLVDEYEVWKEG